MCQTLHSSHNDFPETKHKKESTTSENYGYIRAISIIMKRHAYLILAHTNFGQLRKLVGLLDDPRNDIFVHVDGKADFRPEELDGACTRSRLVFTDRINVSWGGVSIMRAELKLLEAAAGSGHYDYYHLVSGMDLPIKSQDQIHEFFDANGGKEFISMWEFSERTSFRVNYCSLFPEGAGFFLTNLLNNAFKMLQKAVGFKINKGVKFGYASQWFSITDDLARYVIENEGWLEKTFRHTNTCDEIFLPTLVINSRFADKVHIEDEKTNYSGLNRSNMRFIDWSRGESIRHPWTFRSYDWDLLMSVPYFWARKFDERVDSEIIDRIYGAFRNDGACVS